MNIEDRIRIYRDAFDEAGGDSVLGMAELEFFAELLDAEPRPSTENLGIDPTEVAWGFESLALSAHAAKASDSDVIPLYEAAYRLRASGWRRAATLAPIDLWMLVVSGLGAQHQPELRLTLQRTNLDFLLQIEAELSWADRLWHHCVRSFALLARKASSWDDIEEAQNALSDLAALQRAMSPEVTAEQSGEFRKELGLYHVAEALATLGAYLRTGNPQNAQQALRRHSEHARFLLSSVGEPDLELAAKTLEPALAVMANASIWANTTRLSDAARSFARHLASDDAVNPVSELWYSQRQALTNSLLDPFKSAISVEMPTSAGKTLLAELSIVQTLALNPGSTIAYVVPTRALVNQITRRLRNDLQGGQIDGRETSVESAVPVFQLDPTENSLLSSRPDILVSTPEKLDLLIRTKHPSVEELSLVVVDEAHQISEASRGPRLELLLATLKRERGQRCRFLLLTPFLPNASELASWLGDSNNAVVRVNWKPAEQLRAAIRWRRRQGVAYNVLRLTPSITQSSSWDQAELVLGASAIQGVAASRERVSAAAAASLARADQGGVLVLTRGLGTAEKRAQQIAEIATSRVEQDGDDLVGDVAEYVRSELGRDYSLAGLLESGVAFHHAGLPPEIRSLIELLLERGSIRVVCGTSTLSQGVNFPLAAVIIETLKVPQGRGRSDRDMTFAEFWNVAGRAGRALKDPLGLVLYPTASLAQEAEFREYLKREAQDVVSALTEVLVGLDQTSEDYGLKLVRERPALSQFLQYLAHALRVAGYDNAVSDIEEILRSSLGFYRLQESDHEAAQKLIRWSSAFLERTQGAAFLSVADNTGFSLPSVGWMSANMPATARDPEFWDAEHLFGDDLTPLTQVVRILADVPELHLAPTDEAGGIDPRRVAGILRDWVAGRTLPEIADAWYPNGDTAEGLRRAGRYLFRELTGQVPWGMGALQAVTGIATDESDVADIARRAPAMAFYGVSTVASLNMRMAGVPRAAAESIGRGSPEFDSFAAARQWVAERPAERWREAEVQRGIRSGVLERIWQSVGGTTA